MQKLSFIPLFILLLVSACDDGRTGGTHFTYAGDSLDQNALFSDPDSSIESIHDLDARERENWQKPQIVISRLGDLSDKVVADIGAGTGYFTMRLARKAQKVIAIDIQERYLKYINRRLERTNDREHLNVETRLTEADNPRLFDEEADLVLIVNTYAYIEERVDYFSKVHQGIKPNGKLVIVDFKKQPLPVGPSTEEKISADSVLAELTLAGFSVLEVDSTSLAYQYTVTVLKQ